MTAVAETEPETGTTETGQLLRVPRTWVPRPYQYELWEALCDGAKRADVAAHRRWGKDEVALHWAAWAVQNRPGGYWHLLPEASQGRKAIWDAVNPHTGARRIEDKVLAPGLNGLGARHTLPVSRTSRRIISTDTARWMHTSLRRSTSWIFRRPRIFRF